MSVCPYFCFSYPACISNLSCVVLYCHKRHDVLGEKKILSIKYIYIRSTIFFSKFSVIRSEEGLIICTRYSCPILMKLELSRQIFEKKISNVKFHKYLTSGVRQTEKTKL